MFPLMTQQVNVSWVDFFPGGISLSKFANKTYFVNTLKSNSNTPE